jgi:tyrosine-specific transport protein
MIRRKIGATFLVSGTCIGGGMLALPVSTGSLGFFPSISALFIGWVMMTLTALLYLEVCLSMERGSHIVSMSAELLGGWIKGLNALIFAFVSYASLIAYVYGGGAQIHHHLDIGLYGSHLLFVTCFGTFLLWRAKAVERINTLLFAGMLGAYFLLLVIGHDDVTAEHLSHSNWNGFVTKFPSILLVSFSFQVFLVPSITRYLNYDGKSTRWVLIAGTTITFLFYLIWQWLVIGTVPLEQLQTASLKGDPATSYFSRAVSSPIAATIAEFFAFFALATSFLGMALGLQDFLADTLSIKRSRRGMLALTTLVLAPTFLGACYFEKVFTTLLDATGGFGDTIINGMIPVALVWVLRYQRKINTNRCLPFGKIFLGAIFSFYLAIFVRDLFNTLLG